MSAMACAAEGKAALPERCQQPCCAHRGSRNCEAFSGGSGARFEHVHHGHVGSARRVDDDVLRQAGDGDRFFVVVQGRQAAGLRRPA